MGIQILDNNDHIYVRAYITSACWTVLERKLPLLLTFIVFLSVTFMIFTFMKYLYYQNFIFVTMYV